MKKEMIEKIFGDVKEEELREVKAVFGEFESSKKKIEEVKIFLGMKLGSKLHDSWRATRAIGDGKYEPRIKTTKDEAWIKVHGTSEVDIANTCFEDLPKDWQGENLIAGNEAVDLAFDMVVEDEIAPEKIEELSSKVHDSWLLRNEWAKGGELDVPYVELPESEKAKDRDQILDAIDLLTDFFEGKIVMPEKVME